MTLPKIVKKMLRKVKKQDKTVRIVLALFGVYLLYVLFKNMQPEWDKSEKTSSVPTKTMVAGKNDKEAKKWDVKGYPTILMVEAGKVIDTFNGERNVAGLSGFANKHK